MLRSHTTGPSAAALAASVLLACGVASAQVLAPSGSGVETVFASQSDTFQDSDPTGMTFGPAGVGTYPLANTIPAAPVAPAASIAPGPGNAFSTNGGGGYTSIFNDLGGTTSFTAGQSTLDDAYLISPSQTSDIAVTIPAMRLHQGPTAPGYAYIQSTFGANYLITTNPGLLASAAPNFPAVISGATATPGSYAQFDAEIEYSWIPVTVNTAGVITPTGPASSLGILNWTFTQAGGGSYGLTVFSTGGLLATPAGDGIMSLNGHAWLAGDPMTIDVTLMPEPSVGLAGLLGLALARRRRRLSK